MIVKLFSKYGYVVLNVMEAFVEVPLVALVDILDGAPSRRPKRLPTVGTPSRRPKRLPTVGAPSRRPKRLPTVGAPSRRPKRLPTVGIV